jgi:hypothetical protein
VIVFYEYHSLQTPNSLKKSSFYFWITKLKNDMGEFFSSQFNLNVWCKVFYSMLYVIEDNVFTFKEVMDVFLQNLKDKIPMHLINHTTPIIEEKLFVALNIMARGKTFNLNKMVMDFFNHVVSISMEYTSMVQTPIQKKIYFFYLFSLLHKGGKKKHLLNWLPITLFNITCNFFITLVSKPILQAK